MTPHLSPKSRFLVVLAAAVLPAVVGCGSKAPEMAPAVEGVVTINNQPLPNATVTFTPTAAGVGGQYVGTAVTDDKGHFVLQTAGKPGAVVGEHKVTVTEGPVPESLRGEENQARAAAAGTGANQKNRPIPAVYGSLAKTTLTVTVKADQKDYPLQLSR
jgi:hypothetical protein